MSIRTKRNTQEKININLKQTNMSSEKFIEHVKESNPGVDIDKLFNIFESSIKEIQLIPGRNMVLPLDCDMNKAIIAKVVSQYLGIR